MGLQRYWSFAVDDIDIEEAPGLPCSCLFPNPEALVDYSGNSIIAADGVTVHTQLVQINKAGVAFPLTIEQMPSGLYTMLRDYLAATIPGLGSVRLIGTDGIDAVNVLARPDIPNWYTRGEPSGAYVRGVTFNFLSLGV
jgi:hypothetical protein